MAARAPADALQALMMAAAALPNMVPASAQALEVDQAYLNYSHYSEGGRAFVRGPASDLQRPDALQVDTARGGARLRIDDRSSVSLDFSQDTWSGATPYATAPLGFLATTTGASLYVDSNPLAGTALPRYMRVDRQTLQPIALATGQRAPQIVNVMTSASPETRHQGRLSYAREWDEAGLDLNASLSDEPDYWSRSFGGRLRLDFNSKLTSLAMGASTKRSDIDARLGTISNYIDYRLYQNAQSGSRIVSVPTAGTDSSGLATDQNESLRWRGQRKDVAFNVGLTQVIDRSTVMSTSLSYARSEGFLENPHKLVALAFADPTTPSAFNFLRTPVFTVPEKRPDVRNQFTWNLHLARYIGRFDAAAHIDYSHSRDDWGVRADTLELKWVQTAGAWTLTPRVRYYTQTAAEFYSPYFLFVQRFPQDSSGNLDFSRIPVDNWSSDQRLSGFGAISYGVIVSRRVFDDMRLDISYERYRHAGSLKWGGGGEDRFADFHSDMISVGLNYAFGGPAVPRPMPDELAATDPHAHHAHHDHHEHNDHAGADAPAGVMDAHMMSSPGAFMASYSYRFTRQAGHMVTGSRRASDAEVLASCGSLGCPVRPSEMVMHMHMLHLMYAPTADINLMLMPHLMSMSMKNDALQGGFYTSLGGHSHGAMDLSAHTTGGFGDTTAAVLFRLPAPAGMHAHAALGVSIPTGSIDERMAHHGGDLMDFGMQTGSGTWDLMPSLTLAGSAGRRSWGGQLSAVLRPDHRNKSGCVLGDVLQATGWLGWRPSSRFSLSVRGIYTAQGSVRGALKGENEVLDAFGNTSYVHAVHSPADLASNTGGRYVDIGFGASMVLPGREREGDRIALEWIMPVSEKVRGYQLERGHTLALNWNMSF
ncbi:DUF3570 domain-containing protein [Methyloversatilis thermotolerans]|uniref:DUF3570 domain-containing protein n=1 Tax=Methyloversatilis thermotolerans TaxID=1346290 RepID=UPI0003681B35|nr:DUF3570 domain-containing protein [Methyloversatilis thermotolerans]